MDKVYYINLDNSKKRNLLCRDELLKYFNYVERFEAVNGKNIKYVKELEKKIGIKLNRKKICNLYARWDVKIHKTKYVGKTENTIRIEQSGLIGCAASHLLMCYELLHSDDEYRFVFEDDIILCKDFDKYFKLFMDNTPDDYDIVFVGNQQTNLGEQQINLKKSVVNIDYHKKQKFCKILEKCDGKYNLITSNPTYCTHSYIVSRKGAHKILDNAKKYGYGIIDIDIKLNKNLIVYSWIKELDACDKKKLNIWKKRSTGLVYQKRDTSTTGNK